MRTPPPHHPVVVEHSLSGLLALADVPAPEAFVANPAYRLASYWLPLMAGLPAYVLFRHRYPPVRSGKPQPSGRTREA